MDIIKQFEQAYDNFLAGCDVDTTMLDCAEFMFNAGRESVKQAEPVAQPYAHIYEFDSAVFGTHRSFSPNQWNGMKPTRTVTVYTHPAQPVQPAACQYCNGTGDVHGIDGEWRGQCSECKPAGAQGEPVHSDESMWCRYIATMIGGYLGEPVGSDKEKAIAGIIERRLWNLPKKEAPAVAVNEQMLSALRLIEATTLSDRSHEYMKGLAKAAIAEAEKAKGVV